MTKSFKLTLLICLIINIIATILILIFQKNLPPVVPLFYGLPVSTGEIVPSIGLTIPSITAAVITIINFYIIKFTKDKFLQKIFQGITMLVTALSIVTIINIFLLVGKI